MQIVQKRFSTGAQNRSPRLVQPPYPSAQGLVFNTHFFHAMRACNDEVPLGWKQLWPNLSTEGCAAAKQFQP